MPTADGKLTPDEIKAMTPEQQFAYQRKMEAGNTSIKLLEEEKRQQAEHLQRVIKMRNEIEKILIDNKATWMDWNSIVTAFNDRNDIVMPSLSIQFIKERSER